MSNITVNSECQQCTWTTLCDACYKDLMDSTLYATEDILHDLPGLIETFGEEDELVIEFRAVLKSRGEGDRID